MPAFDTRTPSRVARRRFLAAGAVTLGNLLRLRAEAPAREPARAESCILIFLNGGLSHLDTFDPKPDQPPEIRGEFATVRTSAPGVLMTEHLPKLARRAHHLPVVRSIG